MSLVDPVPVVPGDVVDGAVKKRGEMLSFCGNYNFLVSLEGFGSLF